MSDTIRAFLYGVLILVSALIPPIVSLIEKIGD
jgi:hypothetical protein